MMSEQEDKQGSRRPHLLLEILLGASALMAAYTLATYTAKPATNKPPKTNGIDSTINIAKRDTGLYKTINQYYLKNLAPVRMNTSYFDSSIVHKR